MDEPAPEGFMEAWLSEIEQEEAVSDMMTVRDHSQPCEHEGTYAVFVNDDYWWCEECPGGKEIVLHGTERTDDNLPEWIMWIEVVEVDDE